MMSRQVWSPSNDPTLETHGERLAMRRCKNIPWPEKSFIDRLYSWWDRSSDDIGTMPDGPTE